MRLIAREGDSAPTRDTDPLAIFRSNNELSGDHFVAPMHLAVNSHDQVAFVASADFGEEGRKSGLWASDRAGRLRCVARVDGYLPVIRPHSEYAESFRVLDVDMYSGRYDGRSQAYRGVNGRDGQGTCLNDYGQLVFWAMLETPFEVPAVREGVFLVNLNDGLCPADLDDGNGLGISDGAVDINDVIYFFTRFAMGDLGADVDDGTGSGTPDFAVDVGDLIYFLQQLELGC